MQTSNYAASARAKSLGTLRDEQPDKPKLPPMPKKAPEHTEKVHPCQPLRAARLRVAATRSTTMSAISAP